MLIVKTIDVKTILCKSNLPACDYAANPYVGCTHACLYCYASFMKRFSNHPEPWGAFLDVKYWPSIQNARRYAGKRLFIGSVTDPYLPQEQTYGRTRALLKQLQRSGMSIYITTKSDLILRDLALIQSIPNACVCFSINTLDERFRRDMDCSASVERRLAAMETFHRAGVRTVCFIAPIFPGITDVPAVIDRVQRHCHAIWLDSLNLRGDNRSAIFAYIRQRHPDLLPLYRDIYQQKQKDYWMHLNRHLQTYAAQLGLDYVTEDESMARPLTAPPVIVPFFDHGSSNQRPGRPPLPFEQLSL